MKSEPDKGFVYIVTNRSYGTLYIGSTDDIRRRVEEHRKGKCYFTQKYGLYRLVWYEEQESLEYARKREHQIKKWNREWKIRMIVEKNPRWIDLYSGL